MKTNQKKSNEKKENGGSQTMPQQIGKENMDRMTGLAIIKFTVQATDTKRIRYHKWGTIYESLARIRSPHQKWIHRCFLQSATQKKAEMYLEAWLKKEYK